MNYLLPGSVPTDLEKRVKLLIENQKEIARAIGQYHKERHALKRKQHLEFVKPLYDKVAKVVRGEYKPTDREGMWYLDDDNDDDDDTTEEDGRDNVIPDYWLTVLKHKELIQDHDEEILKFLDDIRCTPTDEGFLLEFIFTPNKFFENTTLSKTYLLKFTPDEDNAYDYVVPKIYKSIGCRIDWKTEKEEVVEKDEDEGKKKKSTKKGTKNKKKSVKKEKTVPFMQQHKKTFFKFFEVPNSPDGVKFSDMDPLDQRDLEQDIKNGELFIYDIIANSVNYFEEEQEEGEDNEEEDEDEEEDEEINEDEEEHHKIKGFFSRFFRH